MGEPAATVVSFILSGGAGTRLWPLSREDFPKQFHAPAGGDSMLARTARRLTARDPAGPVHVIASGSHAGRVRAGLDGIDLRGGRAIFEPTGRSTAAAVAVATELTLREHGDCLILVAPADHQIATDADFGATVAAGIEAAREGRIVLFGVRPDRPETGFGYVEAGDTGSVRDVLRFVEKPDAATAREFVQSGRFFWNAGIFLFRASTMRQAFAEHAPAIYDAVAQALDAASSDADGTWLPADLYAAVPAQSVDRAIMERARNIAVVPASFQWRDLGSWRAFHEAGSADENGNVIVGDVVATDCRNSYLRSDGRLLAVAGLDGMAVVATGDAVLVTPLAESHKVNRVVDILEASGRRETRTTPADETAAPDS